MMNRIGTILWIAAAAASCAMAQQARAIGAGHNQQQVFSQDAERLQAQRAADAVIKPLLEKDNIPGIAVGIVLSGKSYVFNYGLASKATRTPVTNSTLFELGSISKTFTATLVSLAEAEGHLSLSDRVEKHLPALQGSAFGSLTLLELGTHTTGGLPLQVPDGITNDTRLFEYLRSWHPECKPRTCRTYSNVSIGVLGLVAAKSQKSDFAALEEKQLFPMLGMKSSFINVPSTHANEYAQGYTRDDVPARMSAGELSDEAYGVKTNAEDMTRFLMANLGEGITNAKLRQAIEKTRAGYFRAGPLTQDLIWEQYPYPVALQMLLAGNSAEVVFETIPATELSPPQLPNGNAWINKTGSTNGFGAYIAYVPAKRMGIVILANKNYPLSDRVTAAFKIMSALASQTAMEESP